jgi:hypothetical protein
VPVPAVVAKPARPRSRPLSQAELVKRLIALAKRDSRLRSSVRLARGPRGQVMPEVTVHIGDAPHIKTPEDAWRECERLFNMACIAYPMDGTEPSNGGEG